MAFAFFDIDRTVLGGRAHLMALYYFWRRGWIKTRSWPGLILVGLAYQVKRLLGRPDTDQLIVRVYSFVAGYSADDLKREMASLLEGQIRKRILSAARREIDNHRSAGRSVILISTALESLADLIGQEIKADRVVSSRLEVKNGYLTGGFERVVFGPEKLRQAESISSDLKQDYFYSDCFSDLSLLRAVGFPRAVNPDWRLKKIAQKEEWPIYYWYN